MSLRTKVGSFVAAVFVVGAIGVAPANAASTPSIPSADSLASLCKSIKQPALQNACSQGTALVGNCSSQKSTSAQIKCLTDAAKKFDVSKVKLPSNLGSLLSKFGGSAGSGGLGGLNISGLLKGFDISKLLGGLKP